MTRVAVELMKQRLVQRHHVALFALTFIVTAAAETYCVRNMISMPRAGLAVTQQGVAGASLARKLPEITLLDVYRTVEPEGEMFSIPPRPNPAVRWARGSNGHWKDISPMPSVRCRRGWQR